MKVEIRLSPSGPVYGSDTKDYQQAKKRVETYVTKRSAELIDFPSYDLTHQPIYLYRYTSPATIGFFDGPHGISLLTKEAEKSLQARSEDKFFLAGETVYLAPSIPPVA